MSERRQAIYAVVLSIPRGRVCSYGEIARLAQLPGLARFVGTVLGDVDTLPWWRVIRSDGSIAFPLGTQKNVEQARRLLEEGIIVKNDRVQGWRELFWRG